MENDKDLNEDFTIVDGQKTVDAGTEVKKIDGNEVEDKDFALVQQDKSIHDTKFTTKPTTFFKDAMKRFSKNHSSVVGAVILGTIFVLSLLLPIEGVLPYNIKDSHPEEANLPMKIVDPKKGDDDFWNGTRWVENQTYPYDAEGKYIGTQYEDDSVIINIRNIKKRYLSDSQAKYSASNRGGYVCVTAKKSDGAEYTNSIVSQEFNYNFAHNYKITFTLGGRDDSDYQAAPKVYLYMITKKGSSTVRIPLNADDPIVPSTLTKSDEVLQEGQTIYSYNPTTFDNVSELVQNAATSKNLSFKNEDGSDSTSDDEKYLSCRLGLAFTTSTEADTAIYIKNFSITSDDSAEASDLAQRSFSDANDTFSDTKNKPTITGSNDPNPYYWQATTDKMILEAYSQTCDLLLDEYLIAYGYEEQSIDQMTIDNWLGVSTDENGNMVQQHDPWIVLDHKNPQFGKLQLTEEGKKHEDEIYVTDILSQTRTTSTSTGEIIYNYTGRVLKWKKFGYKSMPMHVFGTQDKGKDMLKYTFNGTLISLGLGIVVSFINILIGVIWGSISGYFGGVTDMVMERIVDILSGIPSLVLLTVLTLKIGEAHPMLAFGLALCLTGWIGTESVTRSQFYRYRGREYVLAAKTLGARAPRLIFRHILPNAIGTIVTSSVLMIPSVIFSEATISYLGLGLQNTYSLGIILSDAQGVLNSNPYQLLLPAVIISLLMICFNLFGNGLRDAFNPSLKGTD